MKKLVKGRIDGLEVEVAAETTILQAARGLGLAVPTLCHHPGLSDEGSCRLCLVDISFGDGVGKLVASCMYPLRDNNFIIHTDNEAVRSARRFVLQLLINRCPASPRLLALAYTYGVQPDPRFFTSRKSQGNQKRGYKKIAPMLEPSSGLCILCGRCSRACEINGTSAISLVGRGRERVVAGPFYEAPEDCVGCLSCAAVCPTGAIMAEEGNGIRRIWGREFHLIQCLNCGDGFATEEQLSFMGSDDKICPDCRRREISATLKAAQRFTALAD